MNIDTRKTLNGRFWVPISLNMLGQPRKYKKNAPKTIKGVLRPSEVLALLSRSSRYCPVSSRYCPVPRATVQVPSATFQFPRATVQFLTLLSSFLALLSSFLVLPSSFLRYCPVSPRYCPVFSRNCPVRIYWTVARGLQQDPLNGMGGNFLVAFIFSRLAQHI